MTVATAHMRRPLGVPLLLLLAFAGAVAVRVAIAGVAGPASMPAGLVFAVLLVAVAGAARPGLAVSWRAVAGGVVGAAVLVLPVLLTHGFGATHPTGSYLPWAAATAVVATAEEAFLRGALYDAVRRAHSIDLAIVVGAVAFAALHVALYGWRAAPLDLAVGVVLGGLRAATGTWTAPAVAHVGADLLGWWLL